MAAATLTNIRDIQTAVLPNGVKVITELMPHVRSVSLGIWIGSGSRVETNEENGISHFIEHMVFKGTAHRSAEEIAKSVDSIGGGLDAFTSKEMVSFNTKVLDEHMPIAFDVLSDLVLNPLFRDDDIEKEKGVILEEIKMEVDNPEYLIHEIFSSNFWRDHPLGKPILGTDGKPYTTIGFANGPGGSKEPRERPTLTMEQTTDPDFIQQSLVPMTSETHGGEDLGIYAIGPWAHLFQGTVEENYTFHVLNYASQIGARAAQKTQAQAQ